MKEFINSLEHQGCIVQEGELRYVDILKYCSEGIVNSALGNNAGAPYAVALVPPSPNQESAIEFITEGLPYKLRPDEAIVLIGKTPPKAYYYSFRSFLFFVQDKIGKDYSDNPTVGNNQTGKYHMIFGSLGDTINNYNINTENTPDGTLGYPYDSSTIIITTADQYINHQVRKALINAGFSSDIMNNDNLPKDIVNMGLERGKDTFVMLMRASIWENKEIGQEYLDNLDKYWHVLRITPKKPTKTNHPWPIPILKMHETCKTEFNLLPDARYDLNYLRYKILVKYDKKDCEGSANEFFPKDCDVSDNYYVYKMGRKGCGDCVAVIPYSTGNPKGSCYGVDNYQEVFVGFRLYFIL